MSAFLAAVFHWAILILLLWLLIGSLLFMLLQGLGVVESVSLSRAARGRPITSAQMVLAMAMAIVVWPRIGRHLWVHRKATGKMLARILGVRG
jgi:hypothetical protein